MYIVNVLQFTSWRIKQSYRSSPALVWTKIRLFVMVFAKARSSSVFNNSRSFLAPLRSFSGSILMLPVYSFITHEVYAYVVFCFDTWAIIITLDISWSLRCHCVASICRIVLSNAAGLSGRWQPYDCLFWRKLFHYVRVIYLTPLEVVNRAGIEKQLFNKIKKNKLNFLGHIRRRTK